jgi:hypothetical protein
MQKLIDMRALRGVNLDGEYFIPKRKVLGVARNFDDWFEYPEKPETFV